MSRITLGFVEAETSWHLVSHLFPDKVGGRPAWLALSNLPKDIQCPHCQHPMVFLLQIYSPIDDREDCFHRMLFVFMCKNGLCFQTRKKPETCPFRVFRSQLPKNNPFYSADPPIDQQNLTKEDTLSFFRSGKAPAAGLVSNLCPICGCRAAKCCINCTKAYYCSKEHQIIHWKQSHKAHCPNYDYLTEMFHTNTFLLPEFSLSSETFEEDSDDTAQIHESDEEFDLIVEDPEVSNIDKEEFYALEEISRKETKQERFFARFKRILMKEPDQVIRFNRGGAPLWATSTPIAPPACPKCGGKRIFEFQITPQLLSYLKLDKVNEPSPDFATVYIFTCESSCPLAFSNAQDAVTETYAEEYIAFDPVL